MYTQSLTSCGFVCTSRACQLGRRRQRRATLCSASGGGASEDAASTIPDALPVAGSDTDWRAFRAQLVASAAAAGSKAEPTGAPPLAPAAAGQAWAHSLRAPEQGCLLLANPLMFQTSQTYFHMAAILIFTHGPDGAAGLILNRPTEYSVGEMGQGAANLQPEFSPCRLYLGGDVGGDSVNLLHGICGLRESLEVVSGVHLGGFLEAKRGLEEGRFTADQFKVLTRYCGWGPGQLESECARGVWMPVSASKAAILSAPPPTRGSKASVADLWHHIAQLAGGDLAELSKQVRGVADPEIARAAGGVVDDDDDAPEQQHQQDGEGGSGGSGGSEGGGWQPPPQRRRSKLPEADYRDGAGI